MTKREFFEKVIALVNDEDVKAHAEHEIELLDARNERRNGESSKKAKENEPIKKAIIEFLKGRNYTLCSEIAENVGISTQKCTALCGQLMEKNIVLVTDVKVKSKGTRKGYKLV